MKLLVTGGAGFIGANFILYWMNHHPRDYIVNLDKLTYAGNPENLKAIEDNPRYSFIQGDICNGEVVDKAMQGADFVVHFAAESHVDRSIIGPAIFVMTNVVGTQVLLENAVKHKVKRFHHVSTDEVYGSLELRDTNKFNERAIYDPRSPYSASKAGSDHLVRAYWKTYDLPITITNCSNNFGPFQFPEKLIPLAITNVLVGKKAPIYGDGLHVRDWLFVEDHCRAIESVLAKGRIGETYCVGGLTNEINNLQVVRRILAILGVDDDMLEFVSDRPGHDRKYALDWSKIKKELGWEPLHDFDNRLIETINWYKENRSWWESLRRQEKSYYERRYGQ